ncbi:Trypsin [compost metagenome]
MKKTIMTILAAAMILSVQTPVHATEVVKGSIVYPIGKAPVDAVVQIGSWLGFIGSGTYLKGGYVLTAAHVIEDEEDRYLTVSDNTGKNTAIEVEVVAVDKALDLALLKTEKTDHMYLNVSDGTKPWINSFKDYGNTSEYSYTPEKFKEKTGELLQAGYSTIVQRAEKYVGEPISYATRTVDEYTMFACKGNSGSAIIDSYNEIAGLLVATNIATNHAIAIPRADVAKFVNENLPTE